MSPPAWASGLFRRIAVPRLAGSAAVAETESLIIAQLVASGFSVSRQTFPTSARRLVAGSVFPAAVGWLAVALFPLLVVPLPAWIVQLIGLAGIAGIALVSYGIAAGHIPVSAPLVEAANVVATRGSPALWLVAHSDSKCQGVSLRGRVIAAGLTILGVVGLMACLVARSAGPLSPGLAAGALGLALLGGAALSRRPVLDGSPGAVDNATGVIAALVAADHLARGHNDFGVLVTGAEEFGMEGARAWLQSGAAPGARFINFDGIDSRGRYNIMTHGAGTEGAGVAAALCDSLAERGFSARRARLPLGVFVDGAILGQSGLYGVTLSRGDWQTLAVIHTPRDTPDRVDITAAIVAGEAAAKAVWRYGGRNRR